MRLLGICCLMAALTTVASAQEAADWRAFFADRRREGASARTLQRQLSAIRSFFAYARKRRLGPYRAPDQRDANAERDMAALARKGFSLDLARQVVLTDDLETLEEQAGAQPGPLG